LNLKLQSLKLRALKYKQRNAQNKHPLPTFLFLSNNVKEHKKTNTTFASKKAFPTRLPEKPLRHNHIVSVKAGYKGAN
jgi:hypothetical protein